MQKQLTLFILLPRLGLSLWMHAVSAMVVVVSEDFFAFRRFLLVVVGNNSSYYSLMESKVIFTNFIASRASQLTLLT